MNDRHNNDNEPVKLVPGRSDYDLAKEHKAAIIEASKPLLEALTKAGKDGFKFHIQFAENQFTREIGIAQLVIAKEY